MSVPILVVGGGGHAKVVIAALQVSQSYRIIGYTDRAGVDAPVLGVPRLGDDDVIGRLARDGTVTAAAIGVGMLGSTVVRRRIESMLTNLGLALPPVRARSAVTATDVELGEGTLAAEGVLVNPSARIGRCVILNTGCIVEHDAVIGDHAHVAPGAVVCGAAEVGADCLIGAGAIVVQGVRIAAHCVVGAGSVVVAHLTERGAYAGAPARKIV